MKARCAFDLLKLLETFFTVFLSISPASLPQQDRHHDEGRDRQENRNLNQRKASSAMLRTLLYQAGPDHGRKACSDSTRERR